MQPPSEEPLARRAGAARSQMRCTLGIFPLTPREATATAPRSSLVIHSLISRIESIVSAAEIFAPDRF